MDAKKKKKKKCILSLVCLVSSLIDENENPKSKFCRNFTNDTV